MRVVSLANGEPPTAELARSVVDGHDLLIATDGAAHRAAELGLTPDIICGDFDSIDLEAARTQFPRAEYVRTPDQNLADLEKVLLLAKERGAATVTILGAGGGRVDHSLTSVALLIRYHNEFELSMEHDGSAIRAVSGRSGAPGRLSLTTRPNDTISLVAFAAAKGVSLTGVKWPMQDEDLPVGTHGVSNVATGEHVTVEIGNGCLLVCHLY